MTANQYKTQLQALLPKGLAWPRGTDATLTKLMRAFAQELARVDARASALLEEVDPRTTNELLTDQERVAGLPDSCVMETLSNAQRIAALVNKLTTVGGLSKAHYIALAASLGYEITITYFRPWTVLSPVNEPLYGEEWRFVWQVNSQLDTVRRWTVQSPVSDPLASWGNEQLECVMRRYNQSHTQVQFAYA